MPCVEVVLVRPVVPANVGATARAVRNTGLRGLALVEPGSWRRLDCWRTAWGAHEVLEEARVYRQLREALEGTSYVAAFTAREPDAGGMDVRDLASEVAALAEEERVALVFGPETSGLTLEELSLCGHNVRIPTHPDQPSLNLSHAVMIAAYEVFRAGIPLECATPRVTHGEKERLMELLREGLSAIGAVSGPAAEGHFREWRGLLQRTDLTPREKRFLEHAARKMARAGRRAAQEHAPRGPGRQRRAPSSPTPPPFADVKQTEDGFSIPQLKWRELLFTGAVKREAGLFVRDAERPFPRFERPELFPLGSRWRARFEHGRVRLTRLRD